MIRYLYFFIFLLSLNACKSDTSLVDKKKQEALDQAVKVAPQNGISVPHYMCPSGCVGGFADGAGPCPKCGIELMHNQAYHANSTGNVNRTAQQNPQTTVNQNANTAAAQSNFPQPQNATPSTPQKAVIHDASRVIKMPEDKSGAVKIKK